MVKSELRHIFYLCFILFQIIVWDEKGDMWPESGCRSSASLPHYCPVQWSVWCWAPICLWLWQ